MNRWYEPWTTGRPAGLVRRASARLLDGCICMTPFSIAAGNGRVPDPGIAFTLTTFGYELLCVAVVGATLGKLLFRLRVVDHPGRLAEVKGQLDRRGVPALGPVGAAVRGLFIALTLDALLSANAGLETAAGLFLLFSGLVLVFDLEQHRSLHDRLVGSIVVRAA